MNQEDGNDTPAITLVIKVWAQDIFNQLSSNANQITITNAVPSDVVGLTAAAFMRAVSFNWTQNTELDFSHYEYRLKIEAEAWTGWIATFNNRLTRYLSQDEVDTYDRAYLYIEVRAVDTFGSKSGVQLANAQTVRLEVTNTDLADFAITATKLFTNVIVLTGDIWSNGLGGGSLDVGWNTHSLIYNGVTYSIQAGQTDSKYIYWEYGKTVYSFSVDNPVLGDRDFLIAVNIDGFHDLAWNAIANQVIGSAYIEKASIVNAHIDTIDVSKIVAVNLAALSADLGNVIAGNITGVTITGGTFQTALSGRRILMTSEGMTLHVTSGVGEYATFKYGDSTKYGTGALAYIHHSSQRIPFFVGAEQVVGDYHLYNRSSDPSGVATIGDLAVVSGKLKICTVAGTPGTWTVVGAQTA